MKKKKKKPIKVKRKKSKKSSLRLVKNKRKKIKNKKTQKGIKLKRQLKKKRKKRTKRKTKIRLKKNFKLKSIKKNTQKKKMNTIMREMPVLISVNMDKEEVGHTFENYNLVSAGVVNKNNKLVGMITADDVVTVVQEEAEEDVLRLAGVGDEEITDSVLIKTKRRFNWLLLNLFTALLATWVISLFGASIEQMVALAFLMPIVASMGGNAGMQTLAVTIRAIATKELSSGNFNKIVGKEFLIGILNGIIFAIITAIIVQFWFQELKLSLLIGISMILNMIVAGLFGILVPVSLKKVNIDPALASSVFVTTITDVIGFLSFLGIGSYFFLN